MKRYLFILLFCFSLLIGCHSDTRVRVKPKLPPMTKQQQKSLKYNKWHYIAVWLKAQYKLKESVEEIAAELAYQAYLAEQKKPNNP